MTNLPPSAGGGLSWAERRRYARQVSVPGVGVKGQLKLKNASVLVVGAGGLGSPAALYLAAAGIGRLGVIDPDVVDVSNLQRQVIHSTGDVGKMKVESAREKLAAVNPEVRIEIFGERLRTSNALGIIGNYDAVVDGSDNFPARYVTNDACVRLKKPMVYGSVQHVFGQVSVFYSPLGPCFRCLMPEPPPPGSGPGCAEMGVLGVVPGVIGTLQAVEAIKFILGLGTPLFHRLLLYDALETSFDLISVSKDPNCPACGARPSVPAPVDDEDAGEDRALASRPAAVPRRARPLGSISVRELKSRLESGERPFFLEIGQPGETETMLFDGALRIARSEVLSRTSEIPRDREVVVLCRLGIESRDVIRQLREMGFGNLLNLEGGTIAWKYDIVVGP